MTLEIPSACCYVLGDMLRRHASESVRVPTNDTKLQNKTQLDHDHDPAVKLRIHERKEAMILRGKPNEEKTTGKMERVFFLHLMEYTKIHALIS